MNEQDRKAHAVAALFPELTGVGYTELVADIRANGLHQPIMLHPDGSIIDGRNRHRACLEAGVAPRFDTWDGKGSLIALVVSLNLHRRHLNESQRAMLGAQLKPMFEDEAKQRYLATQNNDRGRAALANLPELVEPGNSRDKAAATVNTSPRSVETAVKVLKTGAPELIAAVKAGKVSVHAAEALAPLPAKSQRAILQQSPRKIARAAEDLRKEARQHPRAQEAPKRERSPETVARGKAAVSSLRAKQAAQVEELVEMHLLAMNTLKRFLELTTWLGETQKDFDHAKRRVQQQIDFVAASSAEIERLALEADPMNVGRLRIGQERD